ncbi:MAG: PAS domain S-box protein [Euryarchaeota archaeon]|nr:PAS domain S-box protein [Euryarchaeota archaeon]
MVEQKEKYKIMVIAILLAGACFLTFYFHVTRETGTVFTHFFYVPIILAALWWRRKGLVVAIFLAALLVLSHHTFPREYVDPANDYLRAIMFIVIAGVVAALSERIAKAQVKVTHLNLILRSIRNVNQLIAMEKNRDRLLKGACERLTETRGYHNVWIALLDESVGLVTTAEAGLGEDFLPMVERLKRGELPACGQRALSEPGIVVTQDPLSTCTDCPLAGKYDDRWAMTIRLEHGGTLYGLLCVSIPGELTADEEERALFKEVASDLAFALHSIEQEEERKKAEEELKKEKKFSENIITTVPDSLIVVDKDLRIKTANLSFYQVFQLDPEKVVGCSITDILGDEGGKLSTELTKLLGTKTSVENLELHYHSEKSGERIFSISARGIIVTEGEGEEEEVLVVIGDVTRRKHTEDALLESEEKYRTLSESLPDPVFEIDSAGKVIYLNRAALDTFGRSGEEILSGGVRLNNVIAESELEAARTNLGEIIKGKSHVGERTFVRKDGSRFVGEVHAGPLYKGKRIIGARGVIRDITERKKMEEALRRFSEELELKVEERTEELKKERDYTRHLMESSPDFQLTVDKEGKIMDVNEAFENVVGKSRDIIIGCSIYEYLPKEETEKAIAEIFEKKKVRDIELTANIPEKGVLIWNVSGTVFTSQEGENSIYITGRDLTERRRAEEELRAKEMQLVHAGRLSSLGEMATGIAHEINQPLTVISMAAEGTLRDIEKKRVDMSALPKDLEDIMKNVKRIDKIITHMRTFARKTVEIRAVKPEEVLNNAFILLGEQFKTHAILVAQEIATNLPHIMVDSNQLEQVFINILTNARQVLDEREEEAKKEGETFKKRLVCRISREREKEKEHEWVVYEFADNAYGVPEELKTRVFEPFFTTKEIGEGTGLGLSIAYGIVTRSLRGKIWVEDNEAGGASFKVAIPVANKETTRLHKINTEERKQENRK